MAPFWDVYFLLLREIVSQSEAVNFCSIYYHCDMYSIQYVHIIYLVCLVGISGTGPLHCCRW